MWLGDALEDHWRFEEVGDNDVGIAIVVQVRHGESASTRLAVEITALGALALKKLSSDVSEQNGFLTNLAAVREVLHVAAGQQHIFIPISIPIGGDDTETDNRGIESIEGDVTTGMLKQAVPVIAVQRDLFVFEVRDDQIEPLIAIEIE